MHMELYIIIQCEPVFLPGSVDERSQGSLPPFRKVNSPRNTWFAELLVGISRLMNRVGDCVVLYFTQ